MKTYFKPASLILMLIISANQASAQSEPQLITIPLSRPGETVNLEIDILSARIEVIGEDRQDASFEISVMEGTRKIVTPSGTKSLKTGGRAVFVEYRMEDRTVPIKLIHKMTQAQVKREIGRPELALKWTKTIGVLPWQHIVIFEQQADTKKSRVR